MSLIIKCDTEEIKKKLLSHKKSIKWVFSYLDELIEMKKNTEPGKKIGFKK